MLNRVMIKYLAKTAVFIAAIPSGGLADQIKGNEMVINFECRQCGFLFDCDVGTVTLSENYYRPNFEKEIICPKCGQRSMDEVLLTELGQSQLT